MTNTVKEKQDDGRRLDIQGLRALAVIAVISNHVLGWPSGGFVGVDVFFVISGFLITGLIVREIDETGRFSIARFYRRRFRRIVPAAVVVLAVSVVAGFLLFNRPRALETAWDAVYSLVFAANWRFDTLGTDYFHAADVASPLQHYWSLAVEEQFYLVWPAIVILLFLLAARVFQQPALTRWLIAAALIAVIVGSCSFAASESVANATSAYFSTFTRAWEIAAGALLAIAAPLFARMPLALRVLAGWCGLAGVVASVLIIVDGQPFPAPAAILPVGATVLLLAAGINRPQRWLFPLANPVTAFFGTISYSLYLWHFPVVVFLALVLPDQSLMRTLLSFGGILVLAIITYFLVEQPFHRSPWLESFGRDREKRTAAWNAWRDRFGSQIAFSGIGVALIVAIVVVGAGAALRGTGPATGPAPAPEADLSAEQQVQADIGGALGATTWPDNLSPSLDDAIQRTSNNNPARGCFDIGSTPDIGGCTWGNSDAPNHLWLVGDSTAMAYAPAFKEIAEQSGGQWKATTIGLYGCRFTDVLVQNDGAGVMDACPGRKADIANAIAADGPQLVVVSNAYALGQAAGGGSLSVSDIVAATSRETAKYNASGRVVYLAPPPLGAQLGSCYSAVSSPRDCAVAVGQTWHEFDSATAQSGPTISSLPFTCLDDACPAFAGTLPVRYDSVHLTPEYSTHVAPVIRHELVALGVM